MEGSSSRNWRNSESNQNWPRGQDPFADETQSNTSYSHFETRGVEASQWRDQCSSGIGNFKSRATSTRGYGTNANQRRSESYRGQQGSRRDNRDSPQPIGIGL